MKKGRTLHEPPPELVKAEAMPAEKRRRGYSKGAVAIPGRRGPGGSENSGAWYVREVIESRGRGL
jgi:hypothetical protein